MTIEEAIKQLKKCKSFHNGSYGTALNLAIKALEQARPKGKWSRPSVVAMPYSFAYECPICRQWGNIQTFEPNYCPNCGADMRGENE